MNGIKGQVAEVGDDAEARGTSGRDQALGEVPLATALPDALPLKVETSNACYRGQILLADGSTPQAILKDLTPVELGKELVALALAKELSLAVPDGFLTLVPDDAFTVVNGPLSSGGGRLAYASVDVAQPSVQFIYNSDRPAGVALARMLAAWPHVGSLYGFDTWIANEDRNAGNVLVGGSQSIWLIDHGRILTGPPWPGTALDPRGDYRSRLKEWLTPLMTSDQIVEARTGAAQFEASLRRLDIAAITDRSGVRAFLAPTEVDEATKFLRDRAVLVSYYSNKALGVATML